jgi:predicted nuclease of predicted toxin-antitoxin system
MTTIWTNPHLSPAIATLITDIFRVTVIALRNLGLQDAKDPTIFETVKAQGVILMTYVLVKY